MIKKKFFGPVLQVQDVDSASDWLCSNLFFEKQQNANTSDNEALLINGSCNLHLRQLKSVLKYSKPESNCYFTGFEHIALNTLNISKALDYCKQKNFDLILNNNSWFYNPKVFKEGEYYFNISSPFGVTFEVSQPLIAYGEVMDNCINGTDHFGLPCPDIEQEMEYLQRVGFKPLFNIVENENPLEGRILCCMLAKESIVLEVYQFLDLKPVSIPEPSALAGIYMGFTAVTPGGLQFFE